MINVHVEAEGNIRNVMVEDSKENLNFNTRVIHVGQELEPIDGAVSHPFYLTFTKNKNHLVNINMIIPKQSILLAIT